MIFLFNKLMVYSLKNGFSQFFRNGWKTKKVVWSIFKDNLLTQNQSWTWFNSWVTLVSEHSKDEAAKNKFESSAKRCKSNTVEQLLKSCIYIYIYIYIYLYIDIYIYIYRYIYMISVTVLLYLIYTVSLTIQIYS